MATSQYDFPYNWNCVEYTERRTVGGRTLWYKLGILQQPEQGRACGSGPKSSSDRRPIDPPPILCLRVYEGESLDHCRDITFDYHAEFFMCASLVHARPMANGRVQTPAATSPPVLAGMSASSCSLLMSPEPGAFFMFSDLAIRHEGLYKLQFQLYEKIKDPLDRDIRSQDATLKYEEELDEEDGESFVLRAITESAAFQCFSAKRFPGLLQSSALSQCIADQGCKVRIRREVRMRRRTPGKVGKGKGKADDGDKQGRAQSPPANYSARSGSHSSMDRRPSGSESGPHLPRTSSVVGALPFGPGSAAPVTAGSNPTSPGFSPHSRGSFAHTLPGTAASTPTTTDMLAARDKYSPMLVPSQAHYEANAFNGPKLLPKPSPSLRPTSDTRSSLQSLSKMSLAPGLIPIQPSGAFTPRLLPALQPSSKRRFDENSTFRPTDFRAFCKENLTYARASGGWQTKRSLLGHYHGSDHYTVAQGHMHIDPSVPDQPEVSDEEFEYMKGPQRGQMFAQVNLDRARQRNMRSSKEAAHDRKRRFTGAVI